MSEKRKIIISDFEAGATDETNTEARIWLYGLLDIETDKIKYGNSIDGFMKDIKNKNYTIYFHKLEYDGNFILPYLMNKKNKFKQLTPQEAREKKYKKNSFSTITDDLNRIYMINIYYDFKIINNRKTGKKEKRWTRVSIIDSNKIIPLSVKKIGEEFLSLPKEEQKGIIDYDTIRPENYKATPEEIDYLNKDLRIVGQAIKIMLDKGFNKITISSNAFKEFIRLQYDGNYMSYRADYPKLSIEEDDFIRDSYRGGWTYLNEEYKNIRDREVYGVGLDVNSLYAYTMKTFYFPYGKPRKIWCGELKYGRNMKYGKGYYNDGELWIQNITIQAISLKPGKLPFIQVKDNPLYDEKEYIRNAFNINITVTSEEWKLIEECYNVYGAEFNEGYVFQSRRDSFSKYIDLYYEMKRTAETASDRTVAKLMINGLSGKFSTKPRKSEVSYKEENGVIKTDVNKEEDIITDSYYTAITAFITAYGRTITIRAAMKAKDKFMYADTDSIHVNMKLEELPNIGINIDYDNTKDIGMWKIENIFTDSIFIGKKKYAEYGIEYGKTEELKWLVKASGLPEDAKDQIKTKEDFNYGKQYTGKLVRKTVKNGVLLVEQVYKIREEY